MKLKLFISVLFFTLILTQNRYNIYDTEDFNPLLTGYPIQNIDDDGNIYGAADRFYVSQKYVLERIDLYISFVPENFLDNQEIEVQICEDDNNYPGNIITTQVFSLNTNASQGSLYNISLLNDCISTEAEKYYWLVVLPLEGTDATWIHSEGEHYYYSTTENGGENWSELSVGNAGSATVTGEQIYIPPFDGGDINGDFVVNILDVVNIVQYILGMAEFTDEQIEASDINQDGGINISDVVALINIILHQPEIVEDFLYEDINVNSETYGQMVGPPIYEGMISGYYFGKAG